MPCRRFTFSVALEIGLPGGDPVHFGATLYVPDILPDTPRIMFCFPGGGMTQLYFDLEGASFASAMAGRGILTIAFDHPGTGASRFSDDPFQLTARHLAGLESQAVMAVANQIRDGSIHPSLPPLQHLTMIGVGHSMGAMLVALQQAACKLYAAIALLGFSTRGLPEVLTPEEQRQARQATRGDENYIALAKQRFGNAALAELPSRAGGSAALAAASAPLLTVAAMQSMLPGNIATEAATIDVPIFLAVGDRDIAGRPEAIAPRFAAAPAIRLLVLDNTGHHPFISASADRLYDEIASWAAMIGVAA